MMHKAWCSIEEVPYCFPRSSIKFQGHTAEKSMIWIKFEQDYQAGRSYQIPQICLVHYVPIIVSWNFQELSPRTRVTSIQKVTTQLNRFRTVTPVWIHIWWWNDTYSSMLPYCFSRSSVKFQGHTALKIVKFDPDWMFPDCNSSLN